MVALFIVMLILIWIGAFGSLPNREDIKSMENPLASEVYSADSVLLGRFFLQERSQATYDQISKHVIDALVATEDVRFYKHHGIDWTSTARVLVKTLFLQHESSGGGSTITQQLVKNYFPRRHYFFFSLLINKIRENIIASRLEKVYSKKQILALYLNTVSFGDNTFGIETAADRFFSTSAENISLQDAAVLIGMLKATYMYNPRVFPDRSRARRNVVLAQLHKYDSISQATYDSLSKLPIDLHYNKVNHHDGLAPYFRAFVQQEMLAKLEAIKKESGTEYNLYTDGLKIYTTIDSRMQQYAEQAVRDHMRVVQKEFDAHWRNADPWKAHPEVLTHAIKNSTHYKSLKQQGLSEDAIMQAMNEPVLMTEFAWEGERERKRSPVDSIQYYLKMLNAGVLAMDKNGAIKVWVGGIDHHYFQYDHVRESTKRQVGSTFKPFVYAAALEHGSKPCDYISASKTVYTDMENWTPENGHENYDRKYSMAGGLAHSVNTVSIKLLEEAGIANTIALARRAGITSDIPAVPSIALGTPSISVMEMVAAYASFIHDGKSVQPYYITTVKDKTGRVLLANESTAGDQVMSPETANLTVALMKEVINNGTAASLRTRYALHNDMAGKTGTTQSNSDGWFMGLIPDLVVGTWVGADDPSIRFRSTALGQGAHTALPIFAKFLQQVNADASLRSVSQAHFSPLTNRQERLLACDFEKDDKNFLQKVFGKKDKEVERQKFGEEKKKKGFFKKLFGN